MESIIYVDMATLIVYFEGESKKTHLDSTVVSMMVKMFVCVEVMLVLKFNIYGKFCSRCCEPT